MRDNYLGKHNVDIELGEFVSQIEFFTMRRKTLHYIHNLVIVSVFRVKII